MTNINVVDIKNLSSFRPQQYTEYKTQKILGTRKTQIAQQVCQILFLLVLREQEGKLLFFHMTLTPFETDRLNKGYMFHLDERLVFV